MTDQTSPAATYEISANAITSDRGEALTARIAIADVIARLDLDGGVDLTTRTPGDPDGGSYGQTLAREIVVELAHIGASPTPTAADVPDGLSYADLIAQKVADELDRRSQARMAQLDAELETLAGQAADGLDDQDGPVTRCRQYAEEDAYGTVVVWAHKPDGTWLAPTDVGWRRMAPGHDQPDTPVDELESLGWVEIPIGRQLPAPVASEEPTR